MRESQIRLMLQQVKDGEMRMDDAVAQIKNLPFEDLGYAKVDHHRELRTGYPETIFSEGKTLEQIKGIAQKILTRHQNIMATRATPAVFEALKTCSDTVVYHEMARIVVINPTERPLTRSRILVMSAGTADIPVAEEAAVSAETMGNSVERLYDVGVAGIHRLLTNKAKIDSASVIVVVAGMDGALPSVVAGLTNKPVIAVPTSIGYGASFGGLSALLTMLNSCANGITVVNIDNGYGAGYSASVINHIANKALTNTQSEQ